uniref:Uncharacterized protein n=1 Tax=Rhizophora mucronata TaxID=61149 RepID=A0A2P2QFN7_RHIMU
MSIQPQLNTNMPAHRQRGQKGKSSCKYIPQPHYIKKTKHRKKYAVYVDSRKKIYLPQIIAFYS